jgi:hypothetical protein
VSCIDLINGAKASRFSAPDEVVSRVIYPSVNLLLVRRVAYLLKLEL